MSLLLWWWNLVSQYFYSLELSTTNQKISPENQQQESYQSLLKLNPLRRHNREELKQSSMAENNSRKKPNILITGTPGTGKTTISSLLAEATQLRHINIGELVKQKNLHDGWDDQFECHVMNEDLICDELEDMMDVGGNIVDYHGCDFFPERWFDCVVVLQTNNSVLYDRLSNRGYMGTKLTNNIECEIFQVLLEEAKSSYPENIVIALQSDSVEDISRNVGTLTDWVRSWNPPV